MRENPVASLWNLDRDRRYLNHGGFGACPLAILEARRRLELEFERNPLRYIFDRFEDEINSARDALAGFLGARPENLVFVGNATEGVNAVLRSQELAPGDELLTTRHTFPGCKVALNYFAERAGAKVVTANLPFPLQSEDEAFDAVMAAVGDRTRLALLDHVSSETALIFPLERLIPALQERGVKVLIDGAHAPGMLPLNLAALDADWYTGNCHKWICGPKTAGFLVTRKERQAETRPLIVTFGTGFESPGRSEYEWRFFWRGTFDPTSWLVLPELLEYIGGLHPGGWDGLRARNRALALQGRRILLEALGGPAPAPESMLGSMATVEIPDHGLGEPIGLFHEDRLTRRLSDRHVIDVPVIQWPEPGQFKLRISAQLYNEVEDYEALAAALVEELRL